MIGCGAKGTRPATVMRVGSLCETVMFISTPSPGVVCYLCGGGGGAGGGSAYTGVTPHPPGCGTVSTAMIRPRNIHFFSMS
jgi:hypothetical protein